MTAQNGVPDLVQRWAAAEQRNNAGALDGLLADGFAGVGPFGFILTRDQWLARFANGLVNRSFTITDLQVRDFGTAAVGIGVLAQETSWQGTDNSGRSGSRWWRCRRARAGGWRTRISARCRDPRAAPHERGVPGQVVAAGEGKTVMLFGVRFGYKVVSGDSGGRLAVLEVEIPPRTLVKPHSHAREDEFSLVLSGTVGVQTGDRVSEAGPGAYLVKPRGVPHAMWNAGSTPATVAEILSPAGLEEYFEKLAPILAAHRPAAEYYQLAEDYGITIQDDWIEELERTYGVKL